MAQDAGGITPNPGDRGPAGPAPMAGAEALATVEAVLAASRGAAASGTAPPIGAAELLAALAVLRDLREEMASWEPLLITAARQRGASWVDLAPALGVASRQAAERRYLRLREPAGGQQTGEERVRAERTKRAGDRAVAAWARENASVLRQLAGQVSTLEGLPAAAQHQADLVQAALAGDDPATLLSPLAGTSSHLQATHAQLAERINSATERAGQIRQRTHVERAATPNR
ncbi:MAG: hypothetical protein QOD41_1952 [Cryptosporangiaceae bacterium]|nr:hypothetical protein [Cryptosporangiaceae bacterium]